LHYEPLDRASSARINSKKKQKYFGGGLKVKSIALALIVANFASACGVAAKINARDDLEQSKAAYKQCLIQNAEEPNRCAALRTVYQTDLQTYEAMSRGVRTGPSISVEQSN
jgi:hypothetical protein